MSKCAICRAEFERRYMTSKTCGDPICKAELKRQTERKKVERESTRARKEKLKSRNDWLNEAQGYSMPISGPETAISALAAVLNPLISNIAQDTTGQEAQPPSIGLTR